MSKECKTARNTVITTVIVVLGLLILCSSCGSTYTSCAAYASVEVENEMK